MKDLVESLTKIKLSKPNGLKSFSPRFGVSEIPPKRSRRGIKLTPSTYKGVPETPGVYVFFKDETPIYIGKAINLKRRVSSYFDLDLEGKTARMVATANFLSYVKVDSELESLLLEAKLIRKYMPHYNVIAKDDKHPLYIVITKDEYPRVITARKIDLKSMPIRAYFGPFPSSRNVFSVLRMLRRIFPYSDHKLGKRKCIYSHIGLCRPCPNEIEQIKDTTLKLSEKNKYLKNIKTIKSILEGNVPKVKRDLEKEMDEASSLESFEVAISVRDQIQRLEYITRPQIPTDYFMQNPNLYEDVRTKELAGLSKLLSESGIKIKNLHRIECFDIAHLAGTNPTASMVTSIDGEADKTFYRHFKIKKAKGGDDYESMREVARRRLNHFEDWGKPDLIVVDGGKGQLSSFSEIIKEIPIVGIAKHPDRLIIGEEKVVLKPPVSNLVQRMRDEAHRFARRYHHKLISNSFKGSV